MFATRVPKQALLADDLGDGDDHLQATADRQGRFAMVYSPMGRAFTVKAGSPAGPARRAWWFDPRTGQAKAIEGDFSGNELKFTPPTQGEEQDWVPGSRCRCRELPAAGQRLSRRPIR